MDDAALAELQRKAERLTAAAVKAQAAQLAAEHLGENTALTNVVDFSAGDFEGEPCHVLLLKSANDKFLA